MKRICFTKTPSSTNEHTPTSIVFDCPDHTFEANLALAKSVAHNDTITVEDLPEKEGIAFKNTTEERLLTLETQKANQSALNELHEALELILLGVTE